MRVRPSIDAPLGMPADARRLSTRLRAVDGLRALAVLVVILFHAKLGCSGGFVGVDVFFVISGFLITSLILKDLHNGSFSVLEFWERRARRIAPALVVVTLATLVAGWFLLLPGDYQELGQAAASQALFTANVHYWRETGYFAGPADEKPLLHTWSLAVEEQFYLIVPLLLWALYRVSRFGHRAVLIAALGVGFTISFAASVYGVAHSPSATFYLLPTRAWELLLGALLSFAPRCSVAIRARPLREFVSLVGLGAILIAAFIYTPETAFPGTAALLPCLGAAALIWTGSESMEGTTCVGHFLSSSPLVFIGLISYSLYLWHWPLLAFGQYLSLTPLSLMERCTLVTVSFAAAILSWRFVENPFRDRRVAAARSTMLGLAGAGLTSICAVGMICDRHEGFSWRFPEQANEFARSKDDYAAMSELTVDDIRTGRLAKIGSNNPELRATVLVWGDSHAAAALPAIDAWLKERGLSGRAATHSSTAPVLDWRQPTRTAVHGLGDDAPAFNAAVAEYACREHVEQVILIACWSRYFENPGEAASLSDALVTTVQRLVAQGCRPCVLLDVPQHSFDVPKALAFSVLQTSDVESLRARPEDALPLGFAGPTFTATIEAAGGLVIDPKPRFLDAQNRHYVIESDGVSLYRDRSHLTSRGAQLMLLPLLRKLL